MKDVNQRIRDFIGLKLKDAKNDQIQLKKLMGEVSLNDIGPLYVYDSSLKGHVETIEAFLNSLDKKD